MNVVVGAERFGIGQPVRRREDIRFVTGTGRYTADITLPRQAHAAVVRSPHPHAAIRRIDTTAALRVPGVLAVLTGKDAEGLGQAPGTSGAAAAAYPKNRDGSMLIDAPYVPFARDRALYVGHEVALVVAETVAAARDGAEAVEVDYEPLPHVVEARDALMPGAPQLHAHMAGNCVVDWEFGDRAQVDAAFAAAAAVATIDLKQTKITQGFMEPRAAIAAYDADEQRWTVHVGCQAANRLSEFLGEHVFGLPPDRFHVIAPDVGGGFGGKIHLYNEIVLVCLAARATGRPVKWVGERSEGLLTDWQTRDQVAHGELAVDAQGRILALRVRQIGNVGAFVTPLAVIPHTWNFLRSTQVLYRTQLCHAEVKVAVTNTCPVNIYRGAGRPEGTYIVERLLDIAAGKLGLCRAEIRRRNLITEAEIPFKTFVGLTYDSGRFHQSQEMALRLADWDGFAARRAVSATEGLLRGIGLANYVEVAGGMPREFGEMRVHGNGRVEVITGGGPMGQGMETAYAQLAVEILGVDFDCIDFVAGDSRKVKWGDGSYATRSMRLGGTALYFAGQKLVDKARAMAGHMLEVAPGDLVFERGQFSVAGTDRTVGLFDIARAAEAGRLPADLGDRLWDEMDYTASGPSFPNGCHVCEVTIDPKTGVVKVERYVAVDDVGRVINPLIVEGQIAGGIGQGIGQALLEQIVYDPATGQLLTGSFMDYAMPRADDVPFYTTALNEVHSPTNPLGVKGAGEGGITGALAAIVGACSDALSGHGVQHIDMPVTGEKVLRAIGAL